MRRHRACGELLALVMLPLPPSYYTGRWPCPSSHRTGSARRHHTAMVRVHICHQHVALTASTVAVSEPPNPFAGFITVQAGEIRMFYDTRLLARWSARPASMS
jgi:hypothetical protein